MTVIGWLLLLGLEFFVIVAVDPTTPDIAKGGIGDDHFNVSFIPGKFDPEKQGPVGNTFHIKYRESGDSDWIVSIKIKFVSSSNSIGQRTKGKQLGCEGGQFGAWNAL